MILEKGTIKKNGESINYSITNVTELGTFLHVNTDIIHDECLIELNEYLISIFYSNRLDFKIKYYLSEPLDKDIHAEKIYCEKNELIYAYMIFNKKIHGLKELIRVDSLGNIEKSLKNYYNF